ncbi:capsid protein [Gerygone associated gemycircularvirus 3]|uniref:Capsid protein n=1 Tax=Gerygone associated gemycircularvirus 3 TaxID=1985383 RepID=T1YTC0_9VIRU|nr:capsid protein [Gerygone associated gemycircularvirus 3]AGU67664.1 capsid protein [Gerygone associated gemycircularvirus 3]
MAYRRKSYSSRVKRRTGRTARRGGRRPASQQKRRTYRKKGAMSKKRILNLTSRKKRDTMLTWTNTTTSGGQVSPRPDAAYVKGDTGGSFLWVPTARDLVVGSNLATIALESARTSTTCYMRGLSEKLRLSTSSGVPWFHRRICFTFKGAQPFQSNFTGDTGSNQLYLENSNGLTRLMFNQAVTIPPNYQNQINSVIFKGAQGVDWSDVIIAPIDTRRISLKYDRTWTYRSGNANGTVMEKKMYHPMNKNIVYDDDESGTSETTSYYSVDSKAGMGDYYVWDIFTSGPGGTATDLLRCDISSTLYWHEK